MLFNSISFLVFFPIVLALYWLLPGRWRTVLLLVASCFFYMAFVPKYIVILFYLIGLDYTLARLIERSRGKEKHFYFLLSLISTLSVLVIFKYFNFFNANLGGLAAFLGWHYGIGSLSLILPIGLSFHTFQSLAYVIEVYRGTYPAEKNFLTYCLYVMYFPQLVAGPIERPAQLLPQLNEVHRFDRERCLDGLKRMGLGFFKKVVVADNLALYVNQVYGQPHAASGLALVAATLFFAIQIYYDFSGYSDIAIGAAHTMGITLMENFMTPYTTRSLQEFWSRWHISLSTWFRDYLYIPLGGNRVPHYRWAGNIVIVFLLSGLWHGANWTYIAWGVIHGTMLVLEQWFRKLWSALGLASHALGVRLLGVILRIEALIVILFAWVFFRSSSLADAWYVIVTALPRSLSEMQSLIAAHAGGALPGALWAHLFEPLILLHYDIKQELLVAGAVVAFLAMEFVESQFGILATLKRMPRPVQWLTWLILVLAVANLGVTNEIPFIYFQF